MCSLYTSKYKIKKIKDLYCIDTFDEHLCPKCNHVMKKWYQVKKNVLLPNNAKIVFLIWRWKCPVCNKTLREYPDFLRKNKHYSLRLIEKTVNNEIKYTCVDNRTISRWKKEFTKK